MPQQRNSYRLTSAQGTYRPGGSVWHYRYAPLFESSFYDILLFQKAYISTCFANQKTSEKIVTFKKKEAKCKNSIQHFCSELLQRQHTPRAVTVAPGTTLSISASNHRSLELCLWASALHLCCVRLLVSCALRWLLLHFTPFQLIKDFTGALYFQTARETCVFNSKRLETMQ